MYGLSIPRLIPRLLGARSSLCVQTGAYGSPILTDAVAHMECKVKSRMETPDHWIVYGEVMEGEVKDEDTKTAAHHRKVGNYY